MLIKYLKMVSIPLLFISPLALADIDAVLPSLAGGIDLPNYYACEQIKKQCVARHDARDLESQISCIQQHYGTDVVCRQTQALEAQTGVLPALNAIHTVGLVTWFSVHYSADGIDNYYLLDNTGHLLGLASSQNPLLAQNPLYVSFMRAYPSGALQSQVGTSRAKTPTAIRNQQDGSSQWVFTQLLKKQDCVACDVVGAADIAYYFDSKGQYQGLQLIFIHPISDLHHVSGHF